MILTLRSDGRSASTYMGAPVGGKRTIEIEVEAKGWIGASWDLSDKGKRARYYRLTALGRKQLVSEQSKWQAFSRAMGLILNPVDQEEQ